MRKKLSELFDVSSLRAQLLTVIDDMPPLMMGVNVTKYSPLVASFIPCVLFNYFYDDVIAYEGETQVDIRNVFLKRLAYDIGVNFPYWYCKYNEVKKLLTSDDVNLMQTSKVTSSSEDTTKSASGSLQKTATTPTGVSVDTSTDEIDITIGEGTHEGENVVDTTGFVDKYTNAQQKYANASNIKGERSGTITREGSYEDLVNLLEKLPASFADEISKKLAKHFIFDYEHEGEYLDE